MSPRTEIESVPMQLPNCTNAVVSEAKLTDYLLSGSHPDGRSKVVGSTMGTTPASPRAMLVSSSSAPAALHRSGVISQRGG